ncbi:hypothetical protein [Lysobacter claricitrinus]|uniref:hypothetical protein n=1 Tax=Lysobacter claricitrinus TaxID=3367728 RepID=UPI0037DA9EEE
MKSVLKVVAVTVAILGLVVVYRRSDENFGVYDTPGMETNGGYEQPPLNASTRVTADGRQGFVSTQHLAPGTRAPVPNAALAREQHAWDVEQANSYGGPPLPDAMRQSMTRSGKPLGPLPQERAR